MKKLLNISKWIWFFVIFTIICSSYALYKILNMQIESSFKTQAIASSKASYILVDSKEAYLLNDKSYITIKISRRYIKCKIEKIKYSKEKQKFEVKLSEGNQLGLIANTKIPVEIIYDTNKVIKSLLEPSV